MLEGDFWSLPTSSHPHSVPCVQGHLVCPSFWLQGRRQLQSFILMSLLSRVMTRTRQETRSFSVKTQLPGLGPRGLLLALLLLPATAAGGQPRLQVGQEDSSLSYFPSLPLILLKACPELSFQKRRAMISPLVAATGSLRISASGLHPDLGCYPHHCLITHNQCGRSYSLSHWVQGTIGSHLESGLRAQNLGDNNILDYRKPKEDPNKTMPQVPIAQRRFRSRQWGEQMLRARPGL